jgi:signal transduction histidine kinase
MLWYGALLLFGLSCFALLVSLLASNAINENIRSAIGGVSQVTMNNLNRSLSPQLPYWPGHLPPETLDNYSSPGIMVEVFDENGTLLYSSDTHNSLGLDTSTWQQLVHGSAPIWYTTDVGDDQAMVEVSAIYAPEHTHPGQPPPTRSVIGVLLVAKSLHDANATLSALQGLLLLTGILVLVLFICCGWVVVGYTLRPLADLVKMAGSIALDTARGKSMSPLSRRVKRPEGEDEMSQVVDAFNEMLSSIESSNASQRRFIADASHELRAPLTTIQGNLAFLIRYLEDIPPAERRTMLADAHGETLRLASLVDELLLLARADASMGQPAPSTAQPAPIVELDRTLLRLVRQMRRRLEIENTSMKIEIGGIEPVRVRGDEENMRRIMVILLDNAIKYTGTEEGKGEGRITVALQRLGKQAVLQVSDTGIGIEGKDLPHIFERFYRADLARSREGTGLGLAIAQTLVEQLNGTITAESTPGKGSTFRVSLPLA